MTIPLHALLTMDLPVEVAMEVCSPPATSYLLVPTYLPRPTDRRSSFNVPMTHRGENDRLLKLRVFEAPLPHSMASSNSSASHHHREAPRTSGSLQPQPSSASAPGEEVGASPQLK